MTPAQPANDLGLPEGTEMIRFGVAGENDFELVGPFIMKGIRPGAASGVIVRPAKGYTFQPYQQFDIKEFQMVDGPENSFMPVKQEEAPVMITATLKVTVTNSFDKAVVEDVLAQLNRLPGFVSLDRS